MFGKLSLNIKIAVVLNAVYFGAILVFIVLVQLEDILKHSTVALNIVVPIFWLWLIGTPIIMLFNLGQAFYAFVWPETPKVALSFVALLIAAILVSYLMLAQGVLSV